MGSKLSSHACIRLLHSHCTASSPAPHGAGLALVAHSDLPHPPEVDLVCGDMQPCRWSRDCNLQPRTSSRDRVRDRSYTFHRAAHASPSALAANRQMHLSCERPMRRAVSACGAWAHRSVRQLNRGTIRVRIGLPAVVPAVAPSSQHRAAHSGKAIGLLTPSTPTPAPRRAPQERRGSPHRRPSLCPSSTHRRL